MQRARQQDTRCRRGKRRCERAELSTAFGDRECECLASRALPQVSCHPPASKHPAVSFGDPLANVLTPHCSPLGYFGQRLARFEDRLLRGGDRGPERDRDLLVRETVQLAKQKSSTLPIGQAREILDNTPPPRSLGNLLFD